MPRVSVLVTCFNHAEYLRLAVESIRSQTFQDFEIIAIDDGSADGSRTWLAEQPDIRSIFNLTNLGTYATLNVGLAAAKGEFVAILNDDDLWQADKLAAQIAVFDQHPEVEIVSTNGHFIDGKGLTTLENPFGFRYPTFSTGQILPELVSRNLFITSAVMVRISAFDKVGPFNASYFGSGDWEMWWRLCELGAAGFVDKDLTSYRIHSANASRISEQILKDDIRLREWMISRIDNAEALSTCNRSHLKGFCFAALGATHIKLGNRRAAREAFAEAVKLHPTRLKSWVRWAQTFVG